jgi:hypothetical protein
MGLALSMAVLGGCIEMPSTPEDPTDGPDAGAPTPDAEAPPDAAPLGPASGIIMSPRHSDLVVGEPLTATIAVRGFHPRPGEALEIQVLEDPVSLGSWVTVARPTAQVTADPTAQDDAGRPLYAFAQNVTPLQGQANTHRLPPGGILRFRVIDSKGDVLRGFDHDAQGCFDQHPGVSLGGLARVCGSRFSSLVLVHTGRTPADQLPGPNLTAPFFLRSKLLLSVAETQAYYTAIDAPPTVAAFRQRYGIDAALAAGTLVEVRYYNAGDLGIGRRIRCARFVDPTGSGVACETQNFGAFGGPLADGLAGAVSDQALPFAEVMMVFRAPADAANAVQFMVYGGNGNLALEAPLDTQGDNPSIPANCLNCHGSGSSYDSVTHSTKGARFLPFDPAAFVFATGSGQTRPAQEERLRQLNQLVAETQPAPGVSGLIEGWYHGATGTVGNAADTRFVPAAWNASPVDAKVYREVVAPYCRTCHASHAGGAQDLSFVTPAQFVAQKGKILQTVCGGAELPMPAAEVTMRAFWQSRARAYLVAALDLPGPCAPRP